MKTALHPPVFPGGRGRPLVVLLLLAALLAIAFPYFERTRNANERPRLLQGIALVEHGSFFIDELDGRHERLDPGPDVSRALEGHLVPNKPPGVGLVAAVAYAVGKASQGPEFDLRRYTAWTRWLTGLVPTVVLAAWVLVRLRRVYGDRVAVAATWSTVFASPLASYAHLAYGHALSAALLVVGAGLLVDVTTPSRTRRGNRDGLRAFAGGLLAAAAVVVEYAAAFAGPVLAVLVLVRIRWAGLGTVLAAIAGAAIPLAGLLAYHDAVFGDPFTTGYHTVLDPSFAQLHGQGVLGLRGPTLASVVTHVFAPDAGLLWWVPLFPFAGFGLLAAARLPDEPTRTDARVALGVLVSFIALVVSLSFDGGWRVGPRYLVAALPFVAGGLAECLTRIQARPGWFGAFTLVAVYGLVANVLAGNFWPHFDTGPIVHPLPEVLLPLWRAKLEPYVLLGSVARGWVRAASVATVVLGWWWIGRSQPSGVRMALNWVGGAVLGGVAVLATEHLPQPPESARNLAYIVRVWEPR